MVLTNVAAGTHNYKSSSSPRDNPLDAAHIFVSDFDIESKQFRYMIVSTIKTRTVTEAVQDDD